MAGVIRVVSMLMRGAGVSAGRRLDQSLWGQCVASGVLPVHLMLMGGRMHVFMANRVSASWPGD